MKQAFNWSRFMRLAGGHFRKDAKGYLISCLVFAGISVGLFVLVASSSNDESVSIGNQFFVYLVVIYGALFIFTAGVFQAYQRPREGMFQLLLPASRFEKFLWGWLVSFAGYAVVANAVFFVVRYLLMQYYSARGYAIAGLSNYAQLLEDQKDTIPVMLVLVLVYLFLHAFALYGSLAFRKMAVLKTALALLLVVVSYLMVNRMLYAALFQSEIQQAPLLPFMPLFLKDGGITYQVDIPNWHYWLVTLSIVVTVLLWVVSYHKLREKEG
ncbi:hypothetical protein [Parapedobacter sp. 2B3]|uniref:hypothetical protein n=1 Tax=Parapedobacter sp. 2B3 TaxID=3342381 RepID=UPI0035B67837